jgi:uncharacterized protein (DUF433 family)
MAFDNQYLEAHAPNDVRIKGTRVGLEHFLTAYLAGSLPEEICVEFPTVTLEQVHGVIAWYLRDRTEADAYLRRWETQARQVRRQQADGDQLEVVLRLRQLANERVAQ